MIKTEEWRPYSVERQNSGKQCNRKDVQTESGHGLTEGMIPVATQPQLAESLLRFKALPRQKSEALQFEQTCSVTKC